MKKLIFLLFILTILPMVAAIPGFPHEFCGDVLINGSPAPNGTLVSARITGKDVITNSQNPVATVNGNFGKDGVPLLVQGDLTNGDVVKFYVNNVDSGQTAIFEYGAGPDCVDLSVTITTPPSSGGNTGGSSGGSSSGSSGATGGTTSQPTQETTQISNTEKEKIFSSVDLDTLFGRETNKEDLIIMSKKEITENFTQTDLEKIKLSLDSEKQERLNDLLKNKETDVAFISISLNTYEITDKDNTKKTVSLISTKITAKEDLEELIYIEEISKDIAQSVSEIIFNIPVSEVLNDDPVVLFRFFNVKKGETKEISYTVPKEINTITNNQTFTMGALALIDTPITEEPISEIIDQEPTPEIPKEKSNAVFWIIGIIILVSLGIWIYLKKPFKK